MTTYFGFVTDTYVGIGDQGHELYFD